MLNTNLTCCDLVDKNNGIVDPKMLVSDQNANEIELSYLRGHNWVHLAHKL